MSRNRLGETASPYLRQHADNPVHWWPWSPEAFAEAKARNVPIHLSIGYAACHWCHVMASESFSNPEIAALLNERFVNIKVDREERPDVDQIYMKALHALGEQGGWPLTMFISPSGEPFWGGTYFPPEPRWGRPGFPQLLEGISAAWQRDDEAITKNRVALVEHLNAAPPQAGKSGLENLAPVIDQSVERILSIWDHELGGIRGAPKFPSAPVLEFLWRAGLRNDPDKRVRAAVLTTLRSLVSGGIYDHLAGGFARYSVDDKWLVPHFEKMLSDNGQLLSLLARAAAASGDPMLRDRMVQTAHWLISDMQLPGGGFAASLDADTDHEEGLTYVWSKAEIDSILGTDSATFCEVYDVTDEGNWEGKNVLNRLIDGNPLHFDEEKEHQLAVMRADLLKVRRQRPQPGRDEKVLADWNGVTIAALAEVATLTGEKTFLDASEKAYHFITVSMVDNGRLSHSWCDGRITSAGLSTDYAQMIRAAIALHSATGHADYLQQAHAWFVQLEDNYIDSGAVYLTPLDNADLIVRPVASTDEAMPSAAGIVVQVAAHLYTLTGEDHYRQTAADIISTHGDQISRDIISTASLQSGVDSLMRPRLAYITKENSQLTELLLAEADPALIILQGRADGTPPPKQVPQGGEGPATLYLCEAERCRPPVTEPAEAADLLAQTRKGIVGA